MRVSPLSLWACCLLSASAQAGHWVLVGAEGKPPRRSHYYAAFDRVETRTPLEAIESSVNSKNVSKHLDAARLKRVPVIRVFEGAKDPDTISYTLEFKCQERLVSIADAVVYNRDATTKMMSKPEFVPIPKTWLNGAALVACDEKKVFAAAQAAGKQNNQEPLADLGLVYVGDFVLNTQLADVTWNTFWKEATRPEYTTTRTPEEIEQRRQEVLAQLGDAQKMLGEKAAQVQTAIENDDKEREFIDKVNQTFKTKNNQQQILFFGMEGWTENEIVEFWGVPSSSRELSGMRQLDYFSQDDTRQSYAVVARNGAILSTGETGELRQCEMSLFMREGGGKPGFRLVDYRINGENCRRSTLGKIAK
ncbi:hypothetical protein [Steroidobacter sp.]|uniref:hypothetical protein n=1 Tax=Steroidobacter sp. TaxID=1978227 RepID=UPI001A492F73|nr:hypothetical protein [Steroidobacter sp.]MBL8270286.1 hypothetical protein [Steroidobacter sp.]